MLKASEILSIAKNEIGTKENPANSNNVKYNTAYYGRPVSGNYPWCMVFIWWLFNSSGASSQFYDGGKIASCTSLMKWAKKKGKFITDKSKFKAGDILLYNFDKDDESEHTGILVSMNSSKVTAIEGNTSVAGSQSNGGMVCQKSRPYSQVIGVYRPDYEAEKTPYDKSLPTVTLKKGSKGYQVGLLQNFLNWYGDYKLATDNSFGSLTDKAVRSFQKAERLEVDGSVGKKTRAKIEQIAKEGK